MSKLPQMSGSDVVRALERIGSSARRQHGSHIILPREDPFAQTVVPNHRQIDRRTLRAILRQTDIGVDQSPTCCSNTAPRGLSEPGRGS